MSLKAQYDLRRSRVLVGLAERLERFLIEILAAQSRIDRISARAKTTDSFCKKAAKKDSGGSKYYAHPLDQIQDQVGARIIVYYPQDVDLVATYIADFFNAIEAKELGPDSDQKFGYLGKHFIIPVPSDVLPEEGTKDVPKHFELQIKTMFQHAWSESSHNLAYKDDHGKLTSEERRMIAYAAAQAWGADRIFKDVVSGRIFTDAGIIH